MYHASSRSQPILLDNGHGGILNSREDIDAVAALSQLAGELPNVHVHSTGFLASEHGDGTGVRAQHRDVHGNPFGRTPIINCFIA